MKRKVAKLPLPPGSVRMIGEVPTSVSRSGGSGQLALFEGSHSLVEELLALEPNEMTPLEALNRLSEIKRRIARQ